MRDLLWWHAQAPSDGAHVVSPVPLARAQIFAAHCFTHSGFEFLFSRFYPKVILATSFVVAWAYAVALPCSLLTARTRFACASTFPKPFRRGGFGFSDAWGLVERAKTKACCHQWQCQARGGPVNLLESRKAPRYFAFTCGLTLLIMIITAARSAWQEAAARMLDLPTLPVPPGRD